jgi:preprotein translocase subunit YajC
VTILAMQGFSGGGMTAILIQVVPLIAIMYFLFILPQRKEQKRHRELIASLKPGQEVVTTGGLVGEIIQLRDDLVTIKSGDARVVVERVRIARLHGQPAATSK